VTSTGTRPGPLPDTVAIGASVGAGLCGAVQPEINSELGGRLDSSLLAALVNFGVATVCAVLVVTRRPVTRQHLRTVGSWPVPRWTFLAGLGGVIVVLSGVISIETLGVAVFSVAFFAGQMTSGLLVDRLGIAPGDPRPITRTRVGAVGLALVAVVLSQLGQPVGDVAPALVAFVVGAGAASALQAASNARITAPIGDPMAATTVNVVVGTVGLTAIALTGAVSGIIDAPHWPSELWLYLGGVLGVSIVLALAAASAAIGVLRTTLAMLAAQLVGAFLVDWVRRDEAPTLGVVLGAALTVVAVVLVNRDRARSAPWPPRRAPPTDESGDAAPSRWAWQTTPRSPRSDVWRSRSPTRSARRRSTRAWAWRSASTRSSSRASDGSSWRRRGAKRPSPWSPLETRCRPASTPASG
jgi:transporter family-2 protein